MNTIATIARERAVNCEVRKIAYRQSKDGIVVSFVVHPNEVPAGLATSQLGTRYILALVELDDEDMPKVSEGAVRTLPRRRESSHQSVESRDQGAVDPSRPTSRKSWHEMTPAQQAGILCADKSFQTWLGVNNETDAAILVRAKCKVKTRSDIAYGEKTNDYWIDLVSKYRTWQLAAQVVPNV